MSYDKKYLVKLSLKEPIKMTPEIKAYLDEASKVLTEQVKQELTDMAIYGKSMRYIDDLEKAIPKVVPFSGYIRLLSPHYRQ